MKKTLSIVMAFVLTITMLLPQVFMMTSAAAPSISATTVNAKPGETVDVKISIANNPGVVAVLLTVGFDSSSLTLTKVKDGGILGTEVHSDSLKSPYTLCWANDTATSNFKKNGTLVTLTFKVSGSAKSGNYPISLSYDYENYDIIDKDLNAVSFNVSDGAINVKGSNSNSNNEEGSENNNSIFSIKEPTKTKIKYKNGIVLHAEYNGTAPKGAKYEWTADNDNFTMIPSADGKDCTIISASNGKTVITATLYDKNGTVLGTDTVEMQSKAGFLQKFGAFFRELFGWIEILED